MPITAYLVLALLAESEAHGYELQRKIHDRGFRFWTDIQRASIYNALKRLEKLMLIEGELREGGGPARKVYKLTDQGRDVFHREAMSYLSSPNHPRNEVDLGVLVLPFLDLETACEAVVACLERVRARETFVSEQLAWCRERELELPALNFERPLLSIRADIEWLRRLREHLGRRETMPPVGEWEDYEFREPDYADEEPDR